MYHHLCPAQGTLVFYLPKTPPVYGNTIKISNALHHIKATLSIHAISIFPIIWHNFEAFQQYMVCLHVLTDTALGLILALLNQEGAIACLLDPTPVLEEVLAEPT